MPRALILLLILLCSIASGQSTWNGSVSSVWNLAGNWTGSVPGGATDVIIPSGTPNAPSTNGVSGASCRDLTVNAGATLTCASGFPLTSNRTVTVAGTINGTGGLRLVGTPNGNLTGGGTIGTGLESAKAAGAFMDVTGNVTASSLTLTSGNFRVSVGGVFTLTVTGNATFQGGTLLNNFQGIIDVGGNVTFSGTVATGTLPTFQCGGNWTSDASFSPSSVNQGNVTLDGTGAPTISAVGAFQGLTIAAGSITSASNPSNLTTNGNVTVDGSLAVSGTLDANADVTVGAGGALNVGGGTDTIAGSLIVTAPGAITSTGTIVLDGSPTANLSSASPLPAIQIAKTGGSLSLTGNTTVSSLTQTSGTFVVSIGSVCTLTVTGNATFQGGILQNTFQGIIDVAGNVTFSGTVATSGAPTFQCGGNWTSDASFSPSALHQGDVTLDGTGAQTISGAGIFQGLTIAAGSITSASTVTTNGELIVNGSLAVSGALDANADVTVPAGGALNVGGGTDTIAGSLIVGGTVTSTGTIVMDGSPTANLSSASPLPAIQIAKTGGSLSLTGNTTVSSLTQTSGTFVVSIGSVCTLTVTGNATFQGGILQNTFQGIIDVGGNVTFSGTVATSGLPTFRCGGNWTSDANFSPSTSGQGDVTLNKVGAQTILGAGIFRVLTIAAGSITSASNLTTNGDLTVNGSLAVSGALDANADVTVNPTGALDVGGGADTFAGSLIVTGTFTSTGTVVFDGSAIGFLSSVSPLAAVQVAKTGGPGLELRGNVTASSLTLTSGTFFVSNTAAFTLTVTGNASFQGGTLATLFVGTIDVGGNVTFSGTVAAGPPVIRCHGNWTADANWVPTLGLVELNGSSPTTIGAVAAGGTISFANLVIKNAPKTMANDFTIAAQSVTIDPTGSLAVSTGRHLSIHSPSGSTSVAVNGPLTVAANGELSMGPQTTMTVGSTGTLTLVGAVGQPSKITGAAGGGYALNVQGTLAANNFLVKEAGPGGLVVDLGATLAAFPNNFRNGSLDFRSGATAGSVLLDMRRQAPAADFDTITFLNTPGASGVFNVKTSASGVPIAFVNFAGPFSGPSFENDPNGLIGWNLQAAPPVAFFRVRLGAELVTIQWVAGNNANVASYEIRRSLSATGPFTLIGTQGPGNPGNGYIDQPLAANVPVWEGVWTVLTGGERVLFGVGTATPYSAAPPPNVYKVGGNGPFATIQAAVNAATAPSSVVWVTPGTYPAFTIGSSAPLNLHIASDGTGAVNVDTSSGPVVISNIAAGNGVELGGLTIGTASTGQPGVQVTSCAGTVVLDALTVSCNGSQTAVSVSSSPKVAVQRCIIAGGTGLSVTTGSHVALSKGSLTSLVSTTSTIELADLTPGSMNVTPAGSLQTRGGVMPNIVLNRFASMGSPQVLTIDAFPNAAYIPVASPTMGFTNMSGFEMPILIDPGYVFQFPAMMTDAVGHGVQAFEIEPALVLLGFSYVAQVVCVDPGSGALRMSNEVTVTSMP